MPLWCITVLTVLIIFFFAFGLIRIQDWNEWAKRSENVFAYILRIPLWILWVLSIPFLLILAAMGIAGAAIAVRDFFKP